MISRNSLLIAGMLLLCFSKMVRAQTDTVHLDELFRSADKDEIFGLDRNPKNPNRLDQVFYFNKQIFFTVKLNAKVVNSYFYLNTKKGYSLLDKDFFYKVDAASSIDAHITFPGEKEYFLYFNDTYRNTRLSKVSKTSIPLGPNFLEHPDELLRNFKDWFSPVSAGTEFLGENGRLKSDGFSGAFNGADISIYLSNATETVLQDNYCVGWLGLGYLRLDGEFTRIITRVMSAWTSYQIDLMVEKDVNFVFDGSRYQSVQAKINEVTNKLDVRRDADSARAQARISRTNDVTEKELLVRLEKAKESKLGKMIGKLKGIEVKDGKMEDFHDQMNRQFANPLDDIAIFDAEVDLNSYRTNKKLAKESNPTKKQDLSRELQALSAMKQKLEKYRVLFLGLQTRYAEDPKKLQSENALLYQQMLQEIASGR